MIKDEIQQLQALAKKLAALPTPTNIQRDALSRTRILIGKLELVEAEQAALAEDQAALNASLQKAAGATK